MASPVGGIFQFSHGTTSVNLALSSKLTAAKTGAFNIEVFSGKAGALAKGYQAEVAVTDTVAGHASPHLTGTFPSQLLTGGQLTLFGGAYKIVDTDTSTVTGHTARITAGSGNQTVVGAARDTLIGGTGTQRLDGSKGSESIIGGTHTYTVIGGLHDKIKGNTGATSITAGHIIAKASVESIQIGKAGNYTVTAGNFDTITSAKGNANATITGGTSDRITLNGNTGTVSVVGSTKDTIVAGRGHETIKGVGGDRIGVGSGATVGGTLKFIHSGTVSGGIRFGTNDTVHSTKYNNTTHKATRQTSVAGTSSAHVTVTNFKLGTESLFYQGETSATNKSIVLTATNVTGGTKIILPDGTTMTLVGVTSAQLVTQNNLGHLFKL